MKERRDKTKSWRAVSKDAKNRAVSNRVDCRPNMFRVKPRRKVSESYHVQCCRNVEQSVSNRILMTSHCVSTLSKCWPDRAETVFPFFSNHV